MAEYKRKKGVKTRTCADCNQRKQVAEFDGFAKDCKACKIKEREFTMQKFEEAVNGLMGMGINPATAMMDAWRQERG